MSASFLHAVRWSCLSLVPCRAGRSRQKETYIFEGEGDVRTDQVEDTIHALADYPRHDGLEGVSDVSNRHVLIKHDVVGKRLKEELGAHRERTLRVFGLNVRQMPHIVTIVKVESQDEVALVAVLLGRQNLDLDVHGEEHLPDLFNLSLDVLHKALALGAIVHSEAVGRFLGDVKTWWLDLGVGEAQVLVQVVEPVEEVPHAAAEYLEHHVVAVLANKGDEPFAQGVHDLVDVHAEGVGRRLGEARNHRLRVRLLRGEGGVAHARLLARLLPYVLAVFFDDVIVDTFYEQPIHGAAGNLLCANFRIPEKRQTQRNIKCCSDVLLHRHAPSQCLNIFGASSNLTCPNKSSRTHCIPTNDTVSEPGESCIGYQKA